jgi:pimeloyl-ACP methyl ester carboxylesterase
MTSSSNRRRAAAALAAALLASVAALPLAHAETAACVSEKAAIPVVHYRTAKIDGVDVFYREAGPADAPTVLLLHGFPTSSHMFRNLIPALADRFHVIAPDYPGFGESAAPDHKTFAYTFGHYADIVDGLLTELGVKTYAIYLMDYGAPVGHRLALKHPERVTALIVQNGNAYEEGLKAFWDPIKAYWADGSDAHRAAIDVLVAPETTKFQYTDGVADITRIDGQLGTRPAAARPPGQQGHPARPVPRLRHERAALPEVSGVLPRAEAANADRLGQERQDLSG